MLEAACPPAGCPPTSETHPAHENSVHPPSPRNKQPIPLRTEENDRSGRCRLRLSTRHRLACNEVYCLCNGYPSNPAALLAQQDHPSIAYVAFFSDVEHEVMPVTYGHRVTITYNLYYAVDSSDSEPSALSVPKQISTNEQSFRNALHAILQDPSFLPDGGNLMFGLRHQYPLATAAKSARYVRGRQREEVRARARESARASLRALEGRLKATDGVMLRALRARGLDATLKVLYEARWSQWTREMGYMMADGVLPLPQLSEMIEESALDYLREEGGEVVQDAVVLRERAEAEAAGMTDDRSWYYDSDATPVYWVTDPPAVRSGKGFEKTIQTYGNEPALDVVYWRIWIFARVGPAGQRETVQAAN